MVAARHSDAKTLAVLHGSFALTGVLHAIGGALLPSLLQSFHWNDNRAGLLFLLYFIGTATGALLCLGRYAKLMAAGFMGAALCGAAIARAAAGQLLPLFFLLGVSVGVPMSAVTIFAGRKFGEASAAPLTFLNFSWSAGALVAPLLAARILLTHTYRTAYVSLAVAACIAAIACWLLLEDPPARPVPPSAAGVSNPGWIALFALLTFLEVGIENTTATWLATFAMRGSGTGAALGAASSSLYWSGFLVSRALFAIALLRVHPHRILRGSVLIALTAAVMLVASRGPVERACSMMVSGAALAPIFPLMLSRFFARARNASDSRWVLSVCGFGGSVLPGLTGWISASFHSLRLGLLTVPAALAVIAILLPLALRTERTVSHTAADP